MARRSRGPLRTPGWLLGPGLLVSPVFVALFVAVAPRPVAPRAAVPRLDPARADEALESILAAGDEGSLAEPERYLLGLWKRHSLLRAHHARTGRQTEAVAFAQVALGRGCREVIDDRGVLRALAVSDVLAAGLVRLLERLPAEGREVEPRVEELAGDFLSTARRAGLLDGQGRLREHPLVAAVALKDAFAAECGIEAGTGMTDPEKAARDLRLIRFSGQGLVRAAAAARFARHDPRYPAASSQAAFLLQADRPEEALDVLTAALLASPADRALRNQHIYVRRLLGEGY